MSTTSEPRTSTRLPQIDNLKTLMVAWVIGGHALLGYSATGGWAYDEVNEVTFTPGVELVLGTILGSSGLYMIGVFFFVAGLFSPEALARKGAGGFARDRLRRLGVPFLVSALLLWPLSMWLAYRAAGREGAPWDVTLAREPLLDSGALWFAEILLIYSLAFAAWRRFVRPSRADAPTRALLGHHLIAVAVLVTATTFVVRLWLPARSAQPLDLHLWQWPQLAAMFCLGIVAARQGWATRVPERVYRGCAAVALTAIILVPSLGLLVGVRDLTDDLAPFQGGWNLPALGTAAFEGALVVAGSVWLLGLAQRGFTWHGPLAKTLSRGAFVAFVAQGPVLITLAVAARPLPLPAEAKAVLVGAAGIALCFWLGARLTRR
ncbi:acyltransferase family protein [Actinokineospora xionganensis]|uniref:Acyltransferase n=1 Tax=Actinokineospora xionganensis TaxID=2684470 RepID=A0ABR7KZM0_9PSEU|nr:acyltransferase [Actinokineospora xionganensis]MBC6445880.1 acyltransferase [Actinokineospora xionganensis]